MRPRFKSTVKTAPQHGQDISRSLVSFGMESAYTGGQEETRNRRSGGNKKQEVRRHFSAVPRVLDSNPTAFCGIPVWMIQPPEARRQRRLVEIQQQPCGVTGQPQVRDYLSLMNRVQDLSTSIAHAITRSVKTSMSS
jgi:hypothetical protein